MCNNRLAHTTLAHCTLELSNIAHSTLSIRSSAINTCTLSSHCRFLCNKARGNISLSSLMFSIIKCWFVFVSEVCGCVLLFCCTLCMLRKQWCTLPKTHFPKGTIKFNLDLKIVDYLTRNNLFEPFQSDLSNFHSTETAVTRVVKTSFLLWIQIQAQCLCCWTVKQ